MYLVEQPYINHNSNHNKNLVNSNNQQFMNNNNTLDSPLSSQSISSCELANIEQNLSPSCNNLQMTNRNYNCDTDCLLINVNQQQQLNNYQSNSFINSYSDEKSNCKLKTSQLSNNKTLNQNIVNDPDLQSNYDYTDNKFDKFDNLFCWNSNESINNLAGYSDQLDTNADCDYFLLNRSNIKHELNQIEPDLNLVSMHNDQQGNLNRSNLVNKVNKQVDKKSNLLTASESQQLADILTLNDLNSTPLESSMQLESNQYEQTRSTWQQRSIFEWSTQDQTDFLYSIALQYSYPVEDLRAYFLCYSPIQLANMDKEQMCCINSKYGSTIYQAINLFKSDFSNSFCKF